MPHIRKRKAESKIAAYESELESILTTAKQEVTRTLLRIFLVSAIITVVLVKLYYGIKQ